MDLKIVILREVRQISDDVTYMCNLKKKNGTNELIYKTEMGSYSSKQNDGCPEESRDEEVE